MKSSLAGLTLSIMAVSSVEAQRRAAPAPAPFTVVEASIADLTAALEHKRTTSREIVQQYLLRIATHEDKINAIITVNPNALAIADSLDRLRAAGRILGPLHGIPVALKDNIHTTDMPTTGGALAFADLVPPYEATLTKNLKAAGAIILAGVVCLAIVQNDHGAFVTLHDLPGNAFGDDVVLVIDTDDGEAAAR